MMIVHLQGINIMCCVKYDITSFIKLVVNILNTYNMKRFTLFNENLFGWHFMTKKLTVGIYEALSLASSHNMDHNHGNFQ